MLMNNQIIIAKTKNSCKKTKAIILLIFSIERCTMAALVVVTLQC